MVLIDFSSKKNPKLFLCLFLMALAERGVCLDHQMTDGSLYNSFSARNQERSASERRELQPAQLEVTVTATRICDPLMGSGSWVNPNPELEQRRLLAGCTANTNGCSTCDGQYCQACQNTHWLDYQTCFCVGCLPGCLTCSETGCLTCPPTFFLSNLGTCLPHQNQCASGSSEAGTNRCTSCDPGHFLSDHDCLSCAPGCETCLGLSQCSTCHIGKFLNTQNACELCPFGCAACSSPQNCTQCQAGLLLINGACVSGKSDGCKGDNKLLIKSICLTKEVPKTTYNLDSKTISIAFQQPMTEIPEVLLLLDLKLFTSSGTSFDHFQTKSATWKASGKTLEILIEITKDIFEGYFEISQKDKKKLSFSGESTFLHPEEKLKAFKVSQMSSATFTGIAGSSQTVSAVSGQGASAIMATASPFMPGAGTMMIKIINFFDYLHYTEGKKIVLPNMVLNSAGMVLIPIPIDNYLEIDEAELACRPPSNYEAKTASCSFINNYGMAILIMAIILVLSMSIFVLYKLIYKEASRTCINNCVKFIYSSFGPKYFLINLEAANTEIFGFIFLNVFSSNSTPKMIYSTVLSILMFTGLGALSYFAWKMISDFLQRKNKLSEISTKANSELDSSQIAELKEEKSPGSAPAKQEESDSKTEQMEKALAAGRFSHLNFLIEEYRASLPQWYYYAPLISILKNLLCQLTVVSLADRGLIQVYLLCLIQTSYSALYLKLSPMKERLNNWVSNFTNLLFSGYLMLLLACNYIADEDFVQYKLGSVMAFVLMGILFVNLLYVLYSFVKLVVLATIAVIKAIRAKKEQNGPSEQGEKDEEAEQDSVSEFGAESLKHTVSGPQESKSTTGTVLIDPIPYLNDGGVRNKVFPSKTGKPITRKVVHQKSGIPAQSPSPIKKFTKEETSEMIKQIEQIYGIDA